MALTVFAVGLVGGVRLAAFLASAASDGDLHAVETAKGSIGPTMNPPPLRPRSEQCRLGKRLTRPGWRLDIQCGKPNGDPFNGNTVPILRFPLTGTDVADQRRQEIWTAH